MKKIIIFISLFLANSMNSYADEEADWELSCLDFASDEQINDLNRISSEDFNLEKFIHIETTGILNQLYSREITLEPKGDLTKELFIKKFKAMKSAEIRNQCFETKVPLYIYEDFTDDDLEKCKRHAFQQSVKFIGLARTEAQKIKDFNIQNYSKELLAAAALGYKAGGLRMAVSSALYTGLVSITYDKCVHLSKAIDYIKTAKLWDDSYDKYYNESIKRRKISVR